MLVSVWTLGKQQCNITGKFCVLQPLLLRRESCWIRIMTRNMKIVLLKTCIRHTGTYITFSSCKRSGGDGAICNYFQYLYCNITFVCRRPRNSFMQVGSSMSKFINSYRFLCYPLFLQGQSECVLLKSLSKNDTSRVDKVGHGWKPQSRECVGCRASALPFDSCGRCTRAFPWKTCEGQGRQAPRWSREGNFRTDFIKCQQISIQVSILFEHVEKLKALGIDLLIMSAFDEARRRRHLKVSPSLTSFTQYVEPYVAAV